MVPASKKNPRRRDLVRAPAGTPARTPLSPDAIVEAALSLIDAGGLEGLSMRKLGQALGVEAMAIYHHFDDKGRLLDAVLDRLAEEVDIPDRGPAPPIERLRRAITSYREIAVRHPRAFVLLAGRRFNGERSFAIYERLLSVFIDAGLDAPRAALWFRLVGGYASGAGMADVASRERVRDATPLRLEHHPEDLPYPTVRLVAPHLKSDRLEALFEASLDVLLGALEMELAAKRTASGPKRTARAARSSTRPRA
jgi:AcrR family transcriptional regulator